MDTDITPDPQLTTLVAALIRHILTVAAGAGIYQGSVNDNMIILIASGLVGTASIGWSICAKIAAARKTHKAVLAAARS